MYYCYDLKGIPSLEQEINYAKDLNIYLFYDKDKDSFFDKKGNVVDIKGKIIFVRTGLLQYKDLINKVQEHNGISLTTIEDSAKILNWPNYVNPKRKVLILKGKDILNNDKIKDLFNSDKVFFKTKEKNYSEIVDVEFFSKKDSPFYKALERHKDDDFIISEVVNIKNDEYGLLEFRAFIVNGKIHNISRVHNYLLSQIDDNIILKIEELVKELESNNFPKNFVLDVFISDKGIDILECNPIETSGTYLYNSPLPGIYDLKHNILITSLPKERILYGEFDKYLTKSEYNGQTSIFYQLPGGFAGDVVSYALLEEESNNNSFIHINGSSMQLSTLDLSTMKPFEDKCERIITKELDEKTGEPLRVKRRKWM